VVEVDDYSKYNGYYCGPYFFDTNCPSLRLYLGKQGKIEEILSDDYYLRIYKEHSASELIRLDWWKNLGLPFTSSFYGLSFFPQKEIGYFAIGGRFIKFAIPLTENLLHQLNYNLTEIGGSYGIEIGNDFFQIIFTFPRPLIEYPLNKIIELSQKSPTEIVGGLQALGFDFKLFTPFF